MKEVFLNFERKPSVDGDEVYGAWWDNFYYIILLRDGVFSCCYTHEHDEDIIMILETAQSFKDCRKACIRKAAYVLN